MFLLVFAVILYHRFVIHFVNLKYFSLAKKTPNVVSFCVHLFCVRYGRTIKHHDEKCYTNHNEYSIPNFSRRRCIFSYQRQGERKKKWFEFIPSSISGVFAGIVDGKSCKLVVSTLDINVIVIDFGSLATIVDTKTPNIRFEPRSFWYC